MENFTPVPAFAGGLLIGLSAIIMLLFNGRITGISGIMDGIVINSKPDDRVWRVCFLLGLVLGGFLFNLFKLLCKFTKCHLLPHVAFHSKQSFL